MKTIIRRLRQIEQRLNPPGGEEELRLALMIREQRRLRHLAEGKPFKDWPDEPCGHLTLSETIRRRRLQLRAEALRAEAVKG
jgi:hypothetical protein